MDKPIIVGVDIRALRLAKTGIKTYLEELCREFRGMYDSDIRFHFLDTNLPVYTGQNQFLRILEHLNYQLWKQLILPLKAWDKNCDILFCTDTCVPYVHLGYKTIPTIHDAFCFEEPQNYGRVWLWFYKKTAIPAARRSPYIITPSWYSKKRISHFMKIPSHKLVVVYEGPKRITYNKCENAAANSNSRFAIDPFNYILHVGSMFKRKNITRLIHAFSEIKKLEYPNLKLVLAGSLSTNNSDNEYMSILNALKNTGLEKDVIITGYLDDQELDQIYENALMYVFPSTNEGFGLPILEAFKHSLPVLVANNTCLPEIGGDAVLLFDPFDSDDIFKKMLSVLNDPIRREDMVRKGEERLKLFSWRSTAIDVVNVFRKVGRNQGF